jgi:hypothetical protein
MVRRQRPCDREGVPSSKAESNAALHARCTRVYGTRTPCISGSKRSPYERDVAGERGLTRDSHRFCLAICELLDHRQLQERPLARSGAVSETNHRRSRQLELDGWDPNHTGTMDDRRLLRSRRLAPHIVRHHLSHACGRRASPHAGQRARDTTLT